PATHETEGMTDGDERRLRMADDRVEQPEQRSLPARLLADTLGPLGDAVVQSRIEMPGAARGHINGELAIGERRQKPAAANVEGDCAQLDSSFHERVTGALGGVENCMNYCVMAEVRPGV